MPSDAANARSEYRGFTARRRLNSVVRVDAKFTASSLHRVRSSSTESTTKVVRTPSATGLAFRRAVAAHHVGQRVIAFMTGKLVDALVTPSHRQFAFPWPRIRGRI